MKWDRIIVPLSDWSRREEVELYAKRYSISLVDAIERLVNQGLSHENPPLLGD